MNARHHTWASDGFCVYCGTLVHRTDCNARSTCSDGYRCRRVGGDEPERTLDLTTKRDTKGNQ